MIIKGVASEDVGIVGILVTQVVRAGTVLNGWCCKRAGLVAPVLFSCPLTLPHLLDDREDFMVEAELPETEHAEKPLA